jgi:hypothetical protein
MMRRDDRAQWALASILCVLMLSGPALWNRFPLLQYDTGGYLARWYEGTLVPSRAVAYGLFLNVGSFADFWPVVLLQSALSVWLIALTLRVFGLGGRPFLLTGVTAAMALGTTLPWLTSILLTDAFAGLGVLGLTVLLLRAEALSGRERIGLCALVGVAAATHSATLAVLLAMIAGAPLLWLIDHPIPYARLRNGVVAIGLGVLLTYAANLLVAGQMAWTPGGFALSFGRMLQDGIVEKYLAEHCPDSRLRLCAHRIELPHDADEFFWGSALFDSLGRFTGLGKEMEHIALDSIASYPALQIKMAAVATARQLIDVHTGEGVVNTIWHTYAIIEQRTPWAAPAMHRARQQNRIISFRIVNLIDWPLALLSIFLLSLIAVGARGHVTPDLQRLAAVLSIAILANAIICGVLSNPHDRYGARLAWVPVLVIVITALRLREPRNTA